MAISEDTVISFVKVGLGTLAGFLPPPFNIVLGALGELVDPIRTAAESGGTRESIVAAVKAAMIAASDADMRAELGKDT